jgi:hypothetical protein
MMKSTLLILVVSVIAVMGCQSQTDNVTTGADLAVTPDIEARRAQFVPMELNADVSHLSDGDRTALSHLVAAARIMDEIFRVQAWAGNPDFATMLEGSDVPQAAKDYYRIMVGPWDRLKAFEPFLGDTQHPDGAGYYPEDLGKEEFEAWIEAHPEDQKTFTSLHTMVRRQGGGLRAIPYSIFFQEQLQRAAAELKAAAKATDNPTLKDFLMKRAAAFATDNYYESDLAWMDLDSQIEVVIGPYETYEDGLFGYKAAFEAFVCVAQPEDSKRLAVFKGQLPFLEKNLPIPDEHKNFNRGSESPIRVVDEIFTGGDCRTGVQTLAFNLPNDERVREAKGSKKVLLKNIMHAKYDAILEPIAEHVLPEGLAANLDFDAYFHFILMHELSHGLGPGKITLEGRETEVRLELKDLYSAMEEAKADALGVLNLYVLADSGVVSPEIIEHLPWTYTAGILRTARFGPTEAHGLGIVVQAKYLAATGASAGDDSGRFYPIPEKFREAFSDLSHELLMLQAEGSYEKAQAMVDQFGAVTPEMAAALATLSDIPVDVDPVFPLEGLVTK